jgi:hypothetical protein
LDFGNGVVCYKTSPYVGNGLPTIDILSGLLRVKQSRPLEAAPDGFGTAVLGDY